jgi:outer membrane protein assembly factor BamB
MFHMKQRHFLGLLLLACLLSLAISCIGQEGARGWAGPVRYGDVVIVSTGAGRIDAIDDQGLPIWRFPDMWNIPDGNADNLDGIYGTPLIGSYDGTDVVFVADYNGYVYAFRPGDNESPSASGDPPAASFELDGVVIGGLALDPEADALYITSGSRLYALRASDLVARIDNRDAQVAAVGPKAEGEEPGVLFKADGEIWGAPVLADGKLLLTSLDGGLYAVDPATGSEIWHFEAEQGLVSTPVVADDIVLASGFGSTLFAVNLADGAEQWAFKAKHWIWGDAAVDGEVAYVGDFDGIVHAIDLSSGAEVWSLNLEREAIRSSPVFADGTLVVGSDDGWLVGIDTEAQSIAWQRDVGTKMDADLALEDGDVLIAPRGCVTPAGGDSKVYYTKVDPRNGDLSGISTGVC